MCSGAAPGHRPALPRLQHRYLLKDAPCGPCEPDAGPSPQSRPSPQAAIPAGRCKNIQHYQQKLIEIAAAFLQLFSTLESVIRRVFSCLSGVFHSAFRMCLLVVAYCLRGNRMKSNLWMIDVLKDLHSAAHQRGLVAFAEQLQIAKTVAHIEMSGQPDGKDGAPARSTPLGKAICQDPCRDKDT